MALKSKPIERKLKFFLISIFKIFFFLTTHTHTHTHTHSLLCTSKFPLNRVRILLYFHLDEFRSERSLDVARAGCVQEAMFLPLRNSAWKSREIIPRWFTFDGERISFPRKFHEIIPRGNDSLSADCRCETSSVSSDASWARNVENLSRGAHHFNIISGSCVRWGARPTLVDGSPAIKRKARLIIPRVSLCDWTRNDKRPDETLAQERI